MLLPELMEIQVPDWLADIYEPIQPFNHVFSLKLEDVYVSPSLEVLLEEAKERALDPGQFALMDQGRILAWQMRGSFGLFMFSLKYVVEQAEKYFPKSSYADIYVVVYFCSINNKYYYKVLDPNLMGDRNDNIRNLMRAH